MKAKTKRSGAAGVRKRSAAKDLTTRKDAKGGIIAVLIGVRQVAAGDVNGDGNALKLKR
jgi:hypothetical protein